ncbi:MAG: glutamine--fructose-6-phosphate transaminase (isomerizing), partial [Planctomycetes bacterium]|nr:glutamine--fructose-6-phosphate transaminase (isomerizing) [Planctomycetota bacterium]
MCGIVAAIGLPNAPRAVINGLYALEYRGYDSAGVAWPGAGCLHVRRAPGRVADLEKILDAGCDGPTAAMGHTRWATHGPPSEQNAHPHLSGDGRVAVVHNGIIDNFAALKAELSAEGVSFHSDTDTEVVANLIAKHFAGDLVAAVEAVLPQLDGTYAITVMCHESPEVLVAARRGSPLAVGVGDGFNLAASDAVPIIPHTRNVVFLEDGQVAVITPTGCEIRSGGQPVDYTCTEITWSLEAAQKDGYDHFMVKEIYEQPTVLENMFRNRLRLPPAADADPEFLLEGIDLSDEYFRGVSRIVMLAQGTAYNACMVGRNILERTTKIPSYPEYAADFRYRDPILDPTVLVIAVTQSGETMDTLHAVRLARESGCKVVALVNVVGSSIAREADGVFYLNCGPEIGVASTKAFTAMIAGLYFLALAIGKIRGSISRNDLRRRVLDLMGIGYRRQGVLATEPAVKEIALKY